MNRPIASFSRAVSYDQGSEKGQKPYWGSEEQRCSFAKAEGLHNGREEVLEGLGKDGDMLDGEEDVEPVVF